MEKLPICRLCLAENVRMYVVVNENLHELYERLTDNPFVTEDSRPMLACFICYTKLKQCCQLRRKCMEAEELLTLVMNEDYEPNPLVNNDRSGRFNGLIQSPIVHVSIDDEFQTESDAIKEELPAVCERLDDVIESEKEHLSDELKLEKQYNSWSETEDIPAQQSEPESEDDVPLSEIKTKVEKEQEVSRKKRRPSDTTRSAVAKKPKLCIRGKRLEDVITEYQKKNEESDTKVTRNTSNCPSKLIPKSQESLTNTTSRVNISAIDTTLGKNCRNNIKKRNLTKRIRIRTGEETYKCDICQHISKNKGNLIKHIRVHTGEKPFKCKDCQSCFSEKINLINHIRTHTGEKPYKCEECQLCYSQKSHLTSHIRTHTGDKPYKCEECERCFTQKSALKSHIRTHSGEKPYRCEECQLCFSQKGSLTNHIRTHFSEKPYICEKCGRGFNVRGTLLSHILTQHTGHKPYECEECGRRFGVKSSLMRHIRTHTGEKPHKCDICERCFSRKNILSRHIRTHTSDKPFKRDV